MVVKPFSHLARQSFGKTFTHGYAQSVVAATQSSYASTTTPFAPFSSHNNNRFGRPGTAQVHTSFQNVPSFTGSGSKAGNSQQSSTESNDHGLNAYFEAWQRQQLLHGGETKEWRQYQFAKRIGWTPSGSPVVDATGKEPSETFLSPVEKGTTVELERSYSTSAVDDIKKVEDQVAEAKAVAQIDQAIAEEISSLRSELTSPEINNARQTTAPRQSPIDSDGQPTPPSSQSFKSFTEDPSASSSVSDQKSNSSTDSTVSSRFSKHIEDLYEHGSFAQIPPVFESMLAEGIRPSNQDYNALLASAIRSSNIQHQVVPKALNVYADMLQRKVSPDASFYSTLIELLSSRAIEVHNRETELSKKNTRFGGIGGTSGFVLGSQEAEYTFLSEDDALQNAMAIFRRSIEDGQQSLSATTYRSLVTTCALHGHTEQMVQAYIQMEAQGLRPFASMFPLMIDAFARSGDLSSAVECYNAYKSLAMQDDAGEIPLEERRDNDVYAALVKAYSICGKVDGGERFASRIVDSFSRVTYNPKEHLASVQDAIVLNGTVKHHLDTGDVASALKVAEERNLSPGARTLAMLKVCIAAADKSELDVAAKAFQYLPRSRGSYAEASYALLSLHVRTGNIPAAIEFWQGMKVHALLDASCVDLTAFYATALIRNGRVDEGLMQAREAFDCIRTNSSPASLQNGITDQIDEAIELLCNSIPIDDPRPSANGSLNLIWAMVENGGLTPSAEKLLASLGPDDVASLSWQNVILALQVEAGFIGNNEAKLDIAHPARFAHLLDICLLEGIPFDSRSVELINKAMPGTSDSFPDMARKWQSRQQAPSLTPISRDSFTSIRAVESRVEYHSNDLDPYAATTDFKGSAVILDEIESHRNSSGLNEALLRFRNIRRAGRHPRFLAYAKLITAAAKEGRVSLMHDIVGMARKDVPFIPGNTSVLQGWISILDAMVGACLTTGRRVAAEEFHQELLNIGAAPTANTFGLYITTLKASTKTFDEATEAVSIFNRALTEGATPSSFLYNALIGKLGKARRIDDCLRYFQEMRSAGIRPTSVTYGTVVNALCRVSDERFAEELFDEMESMPNYKPRPAPYNSLMQFFLTTKRDGAKVLAYYDRMRSRDIQPTMHTYKLLIDTYATLEPVNFDAAEAVLDTIRATGQRPEAVHYASLIHAKGCALHDMAGARQIFDAAVQSKEFPPSACLYQALFESMVANHCAAETEPVLDSMSANRVEMTPYIANTLIHGWANENRIAKAKAIFDSVGMDKREPSTYEAMTRAFLTVEDRDGATAIVHEMLSRGYPSAVANKVLELVGMGGRTGN